MQDGGTRKKHPMSTNQLLSVIALAACSPIAFASEARLSYHQPPAEPSGAEQTKIDAKALESAPADADAASLAKKLSNPVADLISIPFQFNYEEGYGPNDAGRATLNIQPVIPITVSEDWNMIVRTIVPIIHQEAPSPTLSDETGMGDILQSFFLSPKEPIDGWIIGAGPVVLWPTGTEPSLRSESFGLGPTAVALRQDSGWTYGALANHVWSVTNSNDHEQVNATFIQPFLSFTWPSATTVGANVESTYDWNTSEWNLPAALTVSQIFTIGGKPVQFTLGGRYFLDSPEGGAEWGVRFVITLLLPRS